MSKIDMKIDRTYGEYPLRPDQMADPITPVSDLFVIAHVGVPDIKSDENWSLSIDGYVESHAVLDIASLRSDFDKTIIEAVHKCAGSPRKPTVPTRQVANVRWGGVLLKDVLNALDILPEAQYLWGYGVDHGNFFGHTVDRYVKDVPVSRVRDYDILLAYEANGEPLSLKHGFPLRLVIPGYYGNNDVKWLDRLHFAEGRASGIFTTTFYNDELPDGKGTKPVWEIDPESVFVAPGDKAQLSAGAIDVWGWAWSNCEVQCVEVSADGGKSWSEAKLEPRRQWSRQRFSHRIHAGSPGPIKLVCRATDAKGQTQPKSGARNEYHALTIDVTDA